MALSLLCIDGAIALAIAFWLFRGAPKRRGPVANTDSTAATVHTGVTETVAPDSGPSDPARDPSLGAAPVSVGPLSMDSSATAGPPSVYSRGAPTTTESRSLAAPRAIAALSTTQGAEGGASSSSMYPTAIPIPVKIVVATAESHTEPGETTPPADAERGAGHASTPPFENRSAQASSLRWSSGERSAGTSWGSSRQWSGSSSIAGRVSGIDLRPPQGLARRNLLLVAGIAVAAVVFSRR